MLPAGHPFSQYMARTPGALDAPGPASDDGLFALLGCPTVVSVDISPYEGATIIHDLNKPGLEQAAGTDADIVLEAGTIEHIFHIPNVFRNVWAVLKPGGVACHIVPVNNFPDHGFYQLSPVLLHTFFKVNGFEVLDSTVIFHDHAYRDPTWRLVAYDPLATSWENYCRDKTCSYAIVARKTERSTCDANPAQVYSREEKHGNLLITLMKT